MASLLCMKGPLGAFVLLLVHLVCCGQLVLGIAPPYPNSTFQWESVHVMRRRLGQSFNYTTKFVDGEMCRFLSEEDCAEADKMMEQHINAHKSLYRQTRNNPNLGTINVLVLMVRFKDHVDRELVGKAEVDRFWQTKVTDWLDVNSQGRYAIKATVIDWITTDNTEAYYSFGKRGIVGEAQQMAWPSLDNLDNRPNWDWSQYDLDGNGELDSVVIIHSGYGAETTTTDCFGAEMDNRIWAHAFSSPGKDTWKSKDGSVKLNGYTMASALDGDCGTTAAKIGLAAHEYTHTMGTEDLYDGADPLSASGIGAFDIMADPYGQNGDADNPGHLSAWSKIILEWLEPVEITANGEYTLKAAEISDEAYRITLGDYGVAEEYLLIENRQPLEFDINIWTGGLVIYHIDSAADLQMNLGYPGQPGWPENGNHYMVAVLPKDGLYDLEKGNNGGDTGDFWKPGDVLGPGKGGTVFPNTDTYSAGMIQETGYWIKVLSQTGTDITFEVGGFDGDPPPEDGTTEQPESATESPTAPLTESPTIGTTPVPTTTPPVATSNPTKLPTQPPSIGATPEPTIAATEASPPTQAPITGTPTATPTMKSTTTSPQTSPPSIQATAALSTSNPTAQTAAPTPPVTSSAPGSLPFGSQFFVSRTPTHEPTPASAYLSSFGPYVVRPTSSPRNPPPTTPTATPAPATGSGFLSNFGSAQDIQMGPPLQQGFLSDSFQILEDPNPHLDDTDLIDDESDKTTTSEAFTRLASVACNITAFAALLTHALLLLL